MIFAVRDDLVQVGRDPEDGTPVYARNLYVIAEDDAGRRFAHEHSVCDREPRTDEEFGTVWCNRPRGDADAEIEALRAWIETAYRGGKRLDPIRWNEIDPAYGSRAYQVLDDERFFRNREIKEAHEAGEISQREAALLMIR